LSFNIVEQAGAWFTFGGERLAQGRDNCLKNLKADPKLFKNVNDAVRKKIKEAEVKDKV